MKKFNKLLNLTSKNANLDELIDESIFIERIIKRDSFVMDVGSGGGIVGIPLKIIRNDLKIYLVERSERKCAFLNLVINALKLKDIFVINEDYRNLKFDFKFDYIIARAIGNYDKMIKILKHLLKEDGSFIIFSDINLKDSKIKKEKYKNLIISIVNL